MLDPLSTTIQCPEPLLQMARQSPPIKTAIINAVNGLVLESAREASEAGIIIPVLVGNPSAMRSAAESIGWDIGALQMIDASGEEAAAAAGAAAAGRGDADAIMKGNLHTDVFMRAVLNRDAGLRQGQPLTHVFHLSLPGQSGSLIMTDCALNPAPDFELKKAILQNAVAVAQATGVKRPKVAILSATEVPNKHIPSSMEAVDLKDWAAGAIADADVDGPLAFDLAVSREAARIKGVSSPVAGAADIILVPEITAGNALYKMLVQYAGACAGGLVVGAKVPVLLTSRSDPPAARLASAALASILGGKPA